MKYIKKFEIMNKKELEPTDINISIIKNITNIRNKIQVLEHEYDELMKNINDYLVEYISLRPELIDGLDSEAELYIEDIIIDSVERDYSSKDAICVNLWTEEPYMEDELQYAIFKYDDLLDFIDFAKSPTEYKDVKKYNL
jgi:hypothetical protein